MCDGGEGGPQPGELPVPGLEVAELRVQEHQLRRGLVWGHGLTQQHTVQAWTLWTRLHFDADMYSERPYEIKNKL